MPPRAEQILGLRWDEENERHVEEHLDPGLIEELIAGRDFFAFPNTAGHPPRQWRIIGRTPDGFWITAILEEPADGDWTLWRPVTAWLSEPFERRMYEAARKRRGTTGRQ
jgi:hypothetical protein